MPDTALLVEKLVFNWIGPKYANLTLLNLLYIFCFTGTLLEFDSFLNCSSSLRTTLKNVILVLFV